MKRLSIGLFAERLLNKHLYPYQITIGDAILDSIFTGAGIAFSVTMARQMGKNELSAAVEAYILFAFQQGSIIKAAPTFKPQILASRMRLLNMLETPFAAGRVWKSYGYQIGLAATPQQREMQGGPRVQFFSAGPEASIVGATASLLLEVDEAQDVDPEKFNRELRPMASTTNATTVLYGTAWSDTTLLATVRANNLALEARDGIRRHFEYDWRTLAAINPHYKKFVEGEIERLGEEHPTIRTQYMLQTISGTGHLLGDLQQRLIKGNHHWENGPDESSPYVLGIDVAGEARPGSGDEQRRASKRDSTIVTVGRVNYNEFDVPKVEIVHQQWFTGMSHRDQYAAIGEIVQKWNVRQVVIDATGLGEALASLLIDRFGADRISAFKFSRPSKSKLTYQFLSLVNSARLKLYCQENAPAAIFQECWKQLKLARYRVLGENSISMDVAEEDGHDDFLMSMALCCEAARQFSAPDLKAQVILPRPDEGGGFY